MGASRTPSVSARRYYAKDLDSRRQTRFRQWQMTTDFAKPETKGVVHATVSSRLHSGMVKDRFSRLSAGAKVRDDSLTIKVGAIRSSSLGSSGRSKRRAMRSTAR
jgi:hypothetical protein